MRLVILIASLLILAKPSNSSALDPPGSSCDDLGALAAAKAPKSSQLDPGGSKALLLLGLAKINRLAIKMTSRISLSLRELL